MSGGIKRHQAASSGQRHFLFFRVRASIHDLALEYFLSTTHFLSQHRIRFLGFLQLDICREVRGAVSDMRENGDIAGPLVSYLSSL